MSTTKTSITRHIDISDIVLFSRNDGEGPLIQQRASTEAELIQHLNAITQANYVVGAEDNHANLVRCEETGDIVEVIWGYASSSQAFESCTRAHWRLVHCVIETGQEIHS